MLDSGDSELPLLYASIDAPWWHCLLPELFPGGARGGHLLTCRRFLYRRCILFFFFHVLPTPSVLQGGLRAGYWVGGSGLGFATSHSRTRTFGSGSQNQSRSFNFFTSFLFFFFIFYFLFFFNF
jgi:hypothetical protein